MKVRGYLFLFLLGVLLNTLIYLFQDVPSYMDAAYYYANGMQIATGKGFTEPFVWNYLNDPQGIPHQSHLYWMPMASLLSALGMLVSGRTDYLSAKIPFVFITSCLPPLTAYFASKLQPIQSDCKRDNWHIWLAGFLALFPGYYALYTSTTDSFTIYMILGSVFILLVPVGGKQEKWRLFSLGIIAGLMHLSRADGILWFVAAIFIGITSVLWIRGDRGVGLKDWVILGMIVMGYLFFMAPWYVRNINLFSSLFPPGGSRTLWLLNYDQIFSYNRDRVDFNNWWRAGLDYHIGTWLNALWTNLKTILGVQGLVYLLPLIITGLFRLRHDARIRFGLIMWAMTLLTMTFVFPYPGARGGYFHSSAAFQPMLWAVSGYGLDRIIHLGVRWRNWEYDEARRFLGVGLIAISALVTGGLFFQRQIGSDLNQPLYRQSWDEYIDIENELLSLGIEPHVAVLINNPPMYYAANGRHAYVIPDGDLHILITVAKRYDVRWLVLEKDHVKGLNILYQQPEQENSCLDYLGSDGANHYFIIKPDG